MGNYLPNPNKSKDTVVGASKNGKLKFVATGMQGWRIGMEDAHIAQVDLVPEKEISLFGVFDGHGGREVAKFVEKHFAEELLKNKNFTAGKYEPALEETFLRMDELLETADGQREVRSYKDEESSGDSSEAGCTANVCLIVKNVMYVANAGDSRCVVCSKGNPVEMSVDHKPDNEVERQRITKAGGYVSDGRVNGNLNLSRALGDLEFKNNTKLGPREQLIIAVPEIKVRTITEDDEFILMGCDGIWETLNVQENIQFIRTRLNTGMDLARSAEELLDANLAPETSAGTGCDNMTCVVVTLPGFTSKVK